MEYAQTHDDTLVAGPSTTRGEKQVRVAQTSTPAGRRGCRAAFHPDKTNLRSVHELRGGCGSRLEVKTATSLLLLCPRVPCALLSQANVSFLALPQIARGWQLLIFSLETQSCGNDFADDSRVRVNPSLGIDLLEIERSVSWGFLNLRNSDARFNNPISRWTWTVNACSSERAFALWHVMRESAGVWRCTRRRAPSGCTPQPKGPTPSGA